MRRPRRKIANKADASKQYAYAHEVLDCLARILNSSGHSPEWLSQEFEDICRKLKKPYREWNPDDLTYVAEFPHVLTYWYTEPKYVSIGGNPKALPLHGPELCLADLIRRVFPSRPVEEVLKTMLRLRVVRRRGKLFEPTSRSVLFGRFRETHRIHGLIALRDQLRTIDWNLRAPQAGFMLLQRAAINPRFSVRALQAFHQATKQSVDRLLHQIDNEMRRWEVPQDSDDPATRLAFGVYVSEDQGPHESNRRAASLRSKPTRRSAK